MKSKNRIRPFKKVCAAVLAAALLFGGFGTSGIGLQPAEAAGFYVEYSTTTFQNIPSIAAEAGVSIYINDSSAFALENATLETTVTGASLRWNLVVSSDADSGVRGLIWSDWSNIKPVSGTYVNGKAQAWTVQTGVSASNPITLSWTDAAQTQYGESLDVKLVITGLDISYVGRTANNAWTDGNYGVNSDGTPRVNLVFMRTEGGGLSIEAYGTADASDASSLGKINNLSFGVDMDYHLEFYNQDGEVYGTFLTYFQDLDIEDIYSYYVAEAKNGWSTSGVTDVDDSSWWNLDNPFVESIRLPDSTSKAYAIDSDSSIIQYSDRHINSTRYTTDSDSNLIASIQAGVDAGETMTWTGSRCTTNLFESYSPGTGTLILRKKISNGQNIDDPDPSGALYAVHQASEDGPIIGYFVTKYDAASGYCYGYVASASSSESSGSVYYNGLYYTATGTTTMQLNIGTYYVEELVAPYGYALDTEAHSVNVTANTYRTAISTDTVNYQQVTLTKESLTADGDEDKNDETSYQYTVTISGLESGQVIKYSVNGGTTVSETAESGGYVVLSGSEIYLKDGQSAVFEIPVGAQYKITESANAKIASYTVEDANSGSKIVSASGTNEEAYKTLSTETETADSGEDVTVTFTNTTKARVPVTLAKVSTEEDGETEDEEDTNYYSYTVTVSNLAAGDIVYFTTRTGSTKQSLAYTADGGATYTTTISNLLLKGGESITLDFPEGAVYKIKEAANSKIASYQITNSADTGSIAKRDNSNSVSETALSTAAETADKGEVITVTFTNTSLSSAYGTLNFDANGGTYSDGTEITAITYEGDPEGYDENTSGLTQYDYDSGSYALPSREGYSFLGWSYSSDASTAYYDGDVDYSVGSSALASIESLFPELTNTSIIGSNRYYLSVPGGDAYDDAYTWYYFGDYTESNCYSEFQAVWENMTTDEDTGLTALEDFVYYEDGDAIWELETAADALIFYTNAAAKTSSSYMLPDGTYYAVYETESGEEVPTAQISLSTTGTSFNNFTNRFVSFNQTLYAVWERDYGYLSLQKTALNEQNFDDPDMDGALYAVHEEDADGEIVGYFITDEDGTGYAASADSADADSTVNLSVSYESETYYATSDTAMYLGTGTYYVEELVAPTWYEAKDIGEVTVTKDNTEDDPCTAEYDAGDGEYVTPVKVTLKKESLAADGSEDTSDSLTYSYKITIGNLESGDVIAYTNRKGTEYTKTAGSTGKISLSLTLMQGEEIWFIIPAGATYTIQETSNKKIASYTVTDANGDSGGTIVSASGANDTPYTALSTETETAEDKEDVTVTFTNTTVEKVQVLLSKQSVTRQFTVNGISPVITNDMSEDGSYSNGFTLSVSAGSDSYTSYQWYYSTSGKRTDFSILEENDRYSLSGTSTDTLTYDSGSGSYWGNPSVWLCCVMTDASGNTTVSETAYMTYYQGSSTEYYSLDETSQIKIAFADALDTSSYEVYVKFAAAITGETITYESDTNEENSGSIAVTSRTGSTTVSIQSGETITFSNVPVGAEYYFREESNARIASYEITNAGSSGTVEGDTSYFNEVSGLSLTTSIQTAESGERTTVTYVNEEEDTACVQLLKVNEDNEPIAGAVFDLYDAEDELLAEGLETGEDGYTEIVEDLAAGDYYFVETDAPDGYAVTSENPIEFTITEDDLGTTVTVTVTDTALQILPNAGGTGIWLLLLMSFGAFCAAVLILRGRRTGIAPV